ncbi:hypothetical protein BDZ89DRAFT_1160859 [Hymenopellis radicata]|nr:hypothetical protein BDZ89DRAFT_1160859 [Hymenopellis radicata]
MNESIRTSSRPIQSCFQCRKRKIKCNRTYPCAPCLLRGEGVSCREVDRNAPSSSKSTAETLDDVLHRVGILERTVLRLSKSIPEDPPPTSPRTSDKSRIRSAYGATSTDEDVAMMLEDFAMGHRINRTRATQDFDTDPYNTPAASSAGVSRNHPLSLLVDPAADVPARLVAILPDEERSRALVEFYFAKLEWYSKVLHAPTFLKEANVAFMQRNTNSTGLIRVSFLGVFFMVLCLSLHLIEPPICEHLGIDFPTASELSKRMYSAAQACINYDDFLGAHSLEHLQCIILMGVYQQNLDEADTHWALLGSAIKIAQNLGMSRLGSESADRTFSASWGSVVKRETARRVWWSLIFNDWSHAAAHNGTYAVHPSQNHTGFPANVNDAELVDGHAVCEHPLEVYTEMSFSLARIRFVSLYREIVDEMNSPTGTGYSFVTEMDGRLERKLEEVPLYFGLGKAGMGVGGVKGLEVTLCLIMGETRRLRLHRPFLFRGYKDRRYTESRIQCITSAQNILNYLKSDDEQSAILLKWWIVLFYGFAAAVVLFIDLCHMKATEGTHEHALEDRREELRQALDLFKTAEHISVVSRNAIVLLEGLLTAEPELPAKPTSRKRARGEEDTESEEPFERVVKRMILEASKNTSSPTSSSSHSSSQSSYSPTMVRQQQQQPVYQSYTPASSPWSLRDEGLFEAPGFGDTTMADLAGLLYNDYGWGEGTAYTAS